MASTPPSFAAVVTGASSAEKISISPKTVSRHTDIPMISFLDFEIDALAAPFKCSLVGTFWYERPPLKVIREVFEKIGFHNDLRITLIDQSHILLNFRQEADYLRCFYRRSWHISGCHMRITKWTVDFDPTTDVPIVPVWVAFPGLPIHLHCHEALFEIVKPIGSPLKLDVATSDALRPTVARVCVEVDVSQELSQKIYLQAKQRLILQSVIYEDLPKYCTACRRLGHDHLTCEPRQSAPSTIPPPPPPPPSRPSKQRWTPVKKKTAAPPSTEPSSTLPPPESDMPPATEPITSAPSVPPVADMDPQEVDEGQLQDTFCDAPDHQLPEDVTHTDLGHLSDTKLPTEAHDDAPLIVPAEVARRMQLLDSSPDDDILISRLPDQTEEAPFVPVVPRRKCRSRKDLPPLPPSTILTHSASQIIQRSVSSLSQ